MKCCCLLNSSAVFMLVLISSFCHGRTLEENYGVSEDCIVATPVGYEKDATLSNGKVIKLYSDMLSLEDVTNCHAVLFCILSPQKQRGKRFLFQHSGCTCYMCAMPSSVTNLYQIGKCYLFENPDVKEAGVNPLLLSAAIETSLGSSHPSTIPSSTSFLIYLFPVTTLVRYSFANSTCLGGFSNSNSFPTQS